MTDPGSARIILAGIGLGAGLSADQSDAMAQLLAPCPMPMSIQEAHHQLEAAISAARDTPAYARTNGHGPG